MDKHSFIDLVGIEFLDTGDNNTAKAQIELQEYHSQVYGNAHGGVVYSLADTVAGYVIWKNASPEIDLVNTIEMKMNYIASVPIPGIIQAVATLKHIGRSTGVSAIDVYYFKSKEEMDKKKLVATGLATFTKMKRHS